MKTLQAPAVAMLEGRAPVIAGAFKAVFDQTYRLWSGIGDLTLDGAVYTGIGARALLTPIASHVGGAADGVTITLSQLDPDVAQSVEAETYHQKPVTIRRLFFAADKHTLLGSTVYMRGRVDFVAQRETVGGEAALDFAIEGPRRDMNRAGARIASDADQRVLGGSGDAAMKHIAVAARKTLRWGQKESVGSVLGRILGDIPGLPPGVRERLGL